MNLLRVAVRCGLAVGLAWGFAQITFGVAESHGSEAALGIVLVLGVLWFVLRRLNRSA